MSCEHLLAIEPPAQMSDCHICQPLMSSPIVLHVQQDMTAHMSLRALASAQCEGLLSIAALSWPFNMFKRIRFTRMQGHWQHDNARTQTADAVPLYRRTCKQLILGLMPNQSAWHRI